MPATILRFAIAVLLVVSVSLQARALDSQSKIDLQAALLNFLELTADENGRFRVIDRDSGKPQHRQCTTGTRNRHRAASIFRFNLIAD